MSRFARNRKNPGFACAAVAAALLSSSLCCSGNAGWITAPRHVSNPMRHRSRAAVHSLALPSRLQKAGILWHAEMDDFGLYFEDYVMLIAALMHAEPGKEVSQTGITYVRGRPESPPARRSGFRPLGITLEGTEVYAKRNMPPHPRALKSAAATFLFWQQTPETPSVLEALITYGDALDVVERAASGETVPEDRIHELDAARAAMSGAVAVLLKAGISLNSHQSPFYRDPRLTESYIAFSHWLNNKLGTITGRQYLIDRATSRDIASVEEALRVVREAYDESIATAGWFLTARQTGSNPGGLMPAAGAGEQVVDINRYHTESVSSASALAEKALAAARELELPGYGARTARLAQALVPAYHRRLLSAMHEMTGIAAAFAERARSDLPTALAEYADAFEQARTRALSTITEYPSGPFFGENLGYLYQHAYRMIIHVLQFNIATLTRRQSRPETHDELLESIEAQVERYAVVAPLCAALDAVLTAETELPADGDAEAVLAQIRRMQQASIEARERLAEILLMLGETDPSVSPQHIYLAAQEVEAMTGDFVPEENRLPARISAQLPGAAPTAAPTARSGDLEPASLAPGIRDLLTTILPLSQAL